MPVFFVTGTPYALVKCPSCGADPNQPCRTQRLGEVKDFIHESRVRLGAVRQTTSNAK